MNDTKQAERFSDDRPVEPMAASVVESMTRAEVDMAIATAHRFPRSLTTFKQRALTIVSGDEDVAESCFFKIKRGKNDDGSDKFIEGPSVRLAEIVASTYGNIRVAARVTEVTATEVVAQGIAIDLESNYSTSVEVRMKITDKYGKKYSSDMQNMTANACCSKARRNALFAVIPFAVIKPIYHQAKLVAVGTVATLAERRTKTIDCLVRAGVSTERIFATLTVKGPDDIGIEQLETLKGLWQAVKDGEQSAAEAFPDAKVSASRFSEDAKKGEEKKP